jgi:hypothetical protein
MNYIHQFFLCLASWLAGNGEQTLQPIQGIEGHVFLIAGNQMPSPDHKPPAPQGVRTTIYIYALTSVNQIIHSGSSPFYSAVHSKFIDSVQSRSDGYFRVELSAGRYSLFTKKKELFYANTLDGQNHIAPATVRAGQLTQVVIKMDYDAIY